MKVQELAEMYRSLDPAEWAAEEKVIETWTEAMTALVNGAIDHDDCLGLIWHCLTQSGCDEEDAAADADRLFDRLKLLAIDSETDDVQLQNQREEFWEDPSNSPFGRELIELGRRADQSQCETS